MEFKDYIKKMRIDKDMKMRELERRSGISQAYISQIENGKRSTPNPEIIKKLADGLNVDYFDLMVVAGYFDKEEAEYRKEILDQVKKDLEKRRKESGEYNYFEVEFPSHVEFEDEEGTSVIRASTAKDVFDLFYLLDTSPPVSVFYKDEELTMEEKQKILTMLKTLLE